MNTYFPDEIWQRLASDLAQAAQHPADPETELQMILASVGIMPESCRDDCEAEVAKAA